MRTTLDSTDFKNVHINAIMGHEDGDECSRYRHGVAISKLKEIVESYSPPLNVTAIVKTGIVCSPPVKETRGRKKKLIPPVFDENGNQIK